MRIDSLDYQQLLLADLDRKRRQTGFSPLVLRPTPAGLKTECAHVCKERFTKRDEPTLRAFFGPADSEQKYLKLIEGCPVDKFRPLVKYLKGETETTDDRNLELLAWLIDFRHRPFAFAKEVQLTDEELAIIGSKAQAKETDTKEDVDKGPKLQDDQGEFDFADAGLADQVKDVDPESISRVAEEPVPVKRFPAEGDTNGTRFRGLAGAMIFLILVICTVTLYNILWPQADKGCMYWTGDHYEPMPCGESKPDTLKLPMDEVKVRTFRRILREDTITEYSIGKIYYIKMNGRIEYYTAGGNHPVEVNRNLRKLSKYIYDKYL
jgi:hypothetical protein